MQAGKKKIRKPQQNIFIKTINTSKQTQKPQFKNPEGTHVKDPSCSLAEEENVLNISGAHPYPKLAGISPGEEEMFI